MSGRIEILAVSAGLLVLGIPGAFGEETPKGKPSGSLDVKSAYVTPSEVGDYGTDQSILATELTLKRGTFSVGYENQMYDWSSPDRLPFGDGDDPWTTLHQLKLGYGYNRPLSDTWFLNAATGAALAFEEEPDHAGSLFGMVMAMWRPGGDWSVTLGGAYRWHQRADVSEPFPVLGLQWRDPSATGWSASLGIPRTRVSYRFDRQWAAELNFASPPSGVYRLRDDSTTVPGGYVSTEGMGGRLGFSYSPTPACSISFGVLLAAGRELELYDRDGDKIADYHVESSLGLDAGVNWRF